MRLLTPLSRASFNLVHRHRLVYNTCWEDPRLDREALVLNADDAVVAITSAGCNVLDYALDSPAHIHAVDLNPRQNALLELKQAGIRALGHEDFFALFGRGRHQGWHDLYRSRLREQLTPWAAKYWDLHGGFFSGDAGRGTFYFHGTTGLVAWIIKAYLDRVIGVRDDVQALLQASSVDAQRDIYDRRIRRQLFQPLVKWLLGRDATLALVAVPRPQREHLERDYPRGIADFIAERIEHVFTRMSLADNYFWRLYLQGHYDADCCPAYLTPIGFARLKAGLVNRVTTHTTSVEAFLRRHSSSISAFVLLDHMDWLCGSDLPALQKEWQAIVDHASPGARVLWRSGGRQTDFVDTLPVTVRGRRRRVGSLLTYSAELTSRLHEMDRVHTYGSFHMAEVTC
jgi:S-adenosylmethionine-diacylglycerol 3-amino-3-carboxypropyl transferase